MNVQWIRGLETFILCYIYSTSNPVSAFCSHSCKGVSIYPVVIWWICPGKFRHLTILYSQITILAYVPSGNIHLPEFNNYIDRSMYSFLLWATRCRKNNSNPLWDPFWIKCTGHDVGTYMILHVDHIPYSTCEHLPNMKCFE